MLGQHQQLSTPLRSNTASGSKLAPILPASTLAGSGSNKSMYGHQWAPAASTSHSNAGSAPNSASGSKLAPILPVPTAVSPQDSNEMHGQQWSQQQQRGTPHRPTCAHNTVGAPNSASGSKLAPILPAPPAAAPNCDESLHGRESSQPHWAPHTSPTTTEVVALGSPYLKVLHTMPPNAHGHGSNGAAAEEDYYISCPMSRCRVRFWVYFVRLFLLSVHLRKNRPIPFLLSSPPAHPLPLLRFTPQDSRTATRMSPGLPVNASAVSSSLDPPIRTPPLPATRSQTHSTSTHTENHPFAPKRVHPYAHTLTPTPTPVHIRARILVPPPSPYTHTHTHTHTHRTQDLESFHTHMQSSHRVLTAFDHWGQLVAVNEGSDPEAVQAICANLAGAHLLASLLHRGASSR